jgi:hypothetical protein
VVVAALIAIFRRALRTTVAVAPGPDWAAEFKPSRYRPMQRLLRESEFAFLSEQPGYQAPIARRLRAERRRIFRQYLKMLQRDFDRFYALAKMMIVHSSEDRSEFAAALVRQRIAFTFAVMSVELRLALHMSGVGIDIAALTGSLESLRLQVQQLSPVPA